VASAYREIGLSAVKDLAVKEVQGVLEHATASLHSNGAAEPAPLLRLEQRAPRRRRRGHGRSAVGLRPIADPDASSRRAHMQAKDAKGKINTSLTSLDQPRSWNDL